MNGSSIYLHLNLIGLPKESIEEGMGSFHTKEV
jgi:hypothetical protein